MKHFLVAFLLVTGCSQIELAPPPYQPPAAAPSNVELIRTIPADLFRGDIDGGLRAPGSLENLTFVFLKNSPADKVPMRVALYSHTTGQPLQLRFVAQLPFTQDECRRGECRARIAELPGGFQISRESFGADRVKQDFRFVRAGEDLELTGQGIQTPTPDGKLCSTFHDYERRRIVHRRGNDVRTEPMQDGVAPRLIHDHLRFEAAIPGSLCALPAQVP